MEKGVVIPVDLFNKTFEFLQDQPYRAVGTLIEELRHSAQVVEVPEQNQQQEEETEDE